MLVIDMYGDMWIGKGMTFMEFAILESFTECMCDGFLEIDVFDIVFDLVYEFDIIVIP